ncbi:hypothetical protein [Mesorhizobium sp.]|nr:hypothetical protein [Mesorhizobium sp.]
MKHIAEMTLVELVAELAAVRAEQARRRAQREKFNTAEIRTA